MECLEREFPAENLLRRFAILAKLSFTERQVSSDRWSKMAMATGVDGMDASLDTLKSAISTIVSLHASQEERRQAHEVSKHCNMHILNCCVEIISPAYGKCKA